MKKISIVKFSKPHLTSTVHRFLSDRLFCWKEPVLASYPFWGLLHKRNSRLHTPFPNARSGKRKVQAQNDNKSNAASKHINCSSISIHYKLNLPRETDAKLQFASKISSLTLTFLTARVHTHHDAGGENQRGNPLGNPASFANCASPATTPSLGINKFLLEPRVPLNSVVPGKARFAMKKCKMVSVFT